MQIKDDLWPKAVIQTFINVYTRLAAACRFQKRKQNKKNGETISISGLLQSIFAENGMFDMERRCRECGAPMSGRSDKRFCCDDCRTAFHNRRYHEAAGHVARINRILRLNRRILAALQAAGIRSIPLSDNRMRGYDRRYFTAMEKAPMRRAVYHCYEYSFIIRSGRLYLRQFS